MCIIVWPEIPDSFKFSGIVSAQVGGLDGSLGYRGGGLERDEWRIVRGHDPADDQDELPVLYDPEHAQFMNVVTADGPVLGYVLEVPEQDRDPSTIRDVSGVPPAADDASTTLADRQERLEERPNIQRPLAYVADYTIVNDDRHGEILGILEDELDDTSWQTGEERNDGYPVIDWDRVREQSTGNLSESRIAIFEDRYEEPVEQQLMLSLIPDGGHWTASGDYVPLDFKDYKVCVYSVESDQPVEAAGLSDATLENIPEDYDVDNVIQLRIDRVPKDKEKDTSLTPKLFEELEEGEAEDVRVRQACSKDLSIADVDPDRPLVLLGSGSGGVPINNIYDTVKDTTSNKPIYLYQTARTLDKLPHRERIQEEANVHDNLYPTHAATREWAFNPDYDGPSDYPQHELLKQVDPTIDADQHLLSDDEQSYLKQEPDPDVPAIDPAEPVFMACGNNRFGEDLERVLDALQVDDLDRHIEVFG